MVSRSIRSRLLSGAALAAVAAQTLLTGCAVGPNYQRPPVDVGGSFKEAEGWKLAQPSDALDRGKWWTVFNDPVLNALEEKVEVSNQNLIAAEAAYSEAKAVVEQNQASLFPTITANGSATRSKSAASGASLGSTTTSGATTSAGSSTTSASGTGVTGAGTTLTGTTSGVTNSTKPTSLYELRGSATWDIDVWGRIRRAIESAKDLAKASEEDIANAKLSAQIALANDYVQLREQDEQKRLTDDTVKAYAKSLQITQNKYNSGVAALSDLLTAQTTLQSAQAQAVDLARTRAALEHAVAVLTGVPPSELNIEAAPWKPVVPEIPVGLPSVLLERRPDVAAAERTMAAANAQIGVNIAGYFPDLSLTGTDGFASTAVGSLFKAANNSWSIGANATQTVFDAGATQGRVNAARAVYRQDVANYRQTVLTALQQVEDAVAGLRVLEPEEKLRLSASDEADRAEKILMNQYQAGTVDYTSVVVAEGTALTARTTAVQATLSRLQYTINLISALGGGWQPTKSKFG